MKGAKNAFDVMRKMHEGGKRYLPNAGGVVATLGKGVTTACVIKLVHATAPQLQNQYEQLEP